MDIYKGKIPIILYFAFSAREISLIVSSLEIHEAMLADVAVASKNIGNDGTAEWFFDKYREIKDLKRRILKAQEDISK